MELDANLVKFKAEIAPVITSMTSQSQILTQKLSNFSSITQNATSALNASFNTNGVSAVKQEITYLNTVVNTISESISSELNTVLGKCSDLLNKIEELEQLIEKYKTEYEAYKAALQAYDNAPSDSKPAKPDYSKVKEIENKFKVQQEAALALYQELLDYDASCTMLSSFSTPANSTDLTDTFGYNGTQFASFMYEEDGVIYQKFMPIFRGKQYTLNNNFTIVYDTAKMIAADKEAGTEAVNFLRQTMSSGKYNHNGVRLWDYQQKRYSNKAGITKVMNQVLEDSYKANNCSSIASYASVAGMVLSQGLVNLKYGGCASGGWNSVGFDTIIDRGGSLVCNEFVGWCYTQGLYKTGNNTKLEDFTPGNIFFNFSKDVTKMTYEELCNLEVGSCLTKKITGEKNNYHIGMVVGYTTVDGEPAIVIAQASDNQNGMSGSYCYVYKVKDCFGTGNNKWQSYTPASVMERRVTAGKTAPHWKG